MSLLADTLALKIVTSSSGVGFNEPGVFMAGSGTGYASFVVCAKHRPSVREICARLAATSSDMSLLEYSESTGQGMFAVIDLDPPAVGETLQLVPALMPEHRRLVYERCPEARTSPPQSAVSRRKKSR